MMYLAGTIADVIEEDPLAILVLDTGHRRYHL